MVWRFRHRVRMRDCDPSGTVFYPRYPEIMTICSEDWFEQEIGLSRADMQDKRRIGMPTVRLSMSVTALSRLGEVLDWQVIPRRLGRSSADLLFHVTCGSEIRLAIMQTIVLMDMDKRAALPWPADIRAALAGRIAGACDPATSGHYRDPCSDGTAG
ncbi:acyl-CoA thioesterase [Paracoccus sp. (in: a-proteobacteria)]|uniref:acyl-CoA thioesterase n=1 Tax=Paracoccus sp. TaxID=267 RepID=UPI003A83B474